jgi:hypothetical protein
MPTCDVASTICQALHPGSETWPKGHEQHMGFHPSMPTAIDNLEAHMRENSATQSATQSAPAATRVRLTGLRGAALLNGREADVRGRASQPPFPSCPT